jgi:hypothetical protein
MSLLTRLTSLLIAWVAEHTLDGRARGCVFVLSPEAML